MAFFSTIPNSQLRGIYNGNCYAFGASGGFIVDQSFSKIRLRQPEIVNKYDVTDAVQVTFSARTLNKKIGILKDSSNINVVQASFDSVSDILSYDSLKLCACEYTDGIDTQSVVTVGRLAYLYSDFKYAVGSYFGDPGGFASLFANEQGFDINNGGVFDASAYIQVVNSSKFTMSGSFVSDLSGQVTIRDINRTLHYAIDADIFRNRNPNLHNYGIVDGFVAGDLIFIPEGFTISLSLDIETETILPINNIGPSYLHAIRDKLNWTKGYVKRSTTSTTTNITQTTTVPILMILTNDTLENYTNYGKNWSIASNVVADSSGNVPVQDASNNWLNISLSTTGKYQSAITSDGDVYVSDDFGTLRKVTTNIGPSESNSIAISYTGKHQTISNGHGIYVSDDYGKTWQQTYTNGTSNIFVSISLTGQYQTMVSCGDNMYRSIDYGVTWTPLNPDAESDLYNSIETFPTAGIALSYNGLYQTIVTENIYISGDFGQTWKNVSNENDFDDRNWQAISMSSDGKYQTAIENGGEIYTSIDYGNTWTFINVPALADKRWESVSLSATGQYQTALEQYGSIYTSNDYGITWSTIDDPLFQNKNWQHVSVSSDGLYQCAVEYGGHIYTSKVFNESSNSQAPPCSCD